MAATVFVALATFCAAPGDLAVPDNQRRMRYDAAGNLITDSYTGVGDRVYDAQNRMTQAWANSQWQYYTYNADGQRTRRKLNNQETWQADSAAPGLPREQQRSIVL